MKYLYYKNIKKIPLNIKHEIEKNIKSIDDILNDLCSGYDTENYLFMILMDRKKLVGLLGIVYISSKMIHMEVYLFTPLGSGRHQIACHYGSIHV